MLSLRSIIKANMPAVCADASRFLCCSLGHVTGIGIILSASPLSACISIRSWSRMDLSILHPHSNQRWRAGYHGPTYDAVIIARQYVRPRAHSATGSQLKWSRYRCAFFCVRQSDHIFLALVHCTVICRNRLYMSCVNLMRTRLQYYSGFVRSLRSRDALSAHS